MDDVEKLLMLLSKTKLSNFLLPLGNKQKVDLFARRDDLIHPEISGNKLRKLKFNLLEAKKLNAARIITFGGAYSNHLLATAAAGALLQIPTVGIVRGEELNPTSNPVLQRCTELGMELVFVTRSKYKETKHFSGLLEINGEKLFYVPEGGANNLAITGAQEIIEGLPEFDVYCIAQGTSTTSIGLLLSLPKNAELWVVPVLKGFESKNEMLKLYPDIDSKLHQVKVLDEHHFGGYGKSSLELDRFISEFNRINEMQTEFVYTGKALFALQEEIKTRNMENKKVLFVHTGGLWKY
jgi:1-aminocyclopropane-1-carboxylate deaminase